MMGRKNWLGAKCRNKLVVKELLSTHILGAKLGKKYLGIKSKKKIIKGQIRNNKWWKKKLLVRGKMETKVGGQWVTIHSHFKCKIIKKYLGAKLGITNDEKKKYWWGIKLKKKLMV